MSKRSPPGDWKEALAQRGREPKSAPPPPSPSPAHKPLDTTPAQPAVATPPIRLNAARGEAAKSIVLSPGSPQPMVRPGPRRRPPRPEPPARPKPVEEIFPPLYDVTIKPRPPAPAGVTAGQGAAALAEVLRQIDLGDLHGESQIVDANTAPSDEVVARIVEGARILAKQPEPDQEGFIVGFDFGTSCSKVVVHQFGAGDRCYALPAPAHLQVREGGVAQEHLWRSAVWFDRASGAFSLEPIAGAVCLEGFKTGLIQSDGHRMVEGVTHTQATAAYLALLIAYTLGFHRLAAPAGFNRNAHFSRFHFGVPVACKDDEQSTIGFARALTAAFELAPHAPDLVLRDVGEFVRTVTPVLKPGATTPFELFEELAGVIAGYEASAHWARGPHVVVDVGAATLDVATFSIVKNDDGDRVPVYMSKVALLGAGALEAARRKGIADETFRLACHQHTRHVISHTFLQRNPIFFPQNGQPKPLLLVGGGRHTDVHERLYKTYPAGLEGPLITPKPEGKVEYAAGTDFARLLLAWGLARDPTELPTLKPPSEIEDYVRRRKDYEAVYVDKDMC